jgi:DNA-binding transcriptional LysR family regulator
MDKFACMLAFTQVVEAGGYAAAARRMGLSRSQVNKLVTQLETSLEVTLLQRTTRHVTPTTTGQAFYQRCLEILAALDEAEQAMTQLHHEPKGRVRINAPLSFGISHLAPLLTTFARQYPDLQVELTLEDRQLDTLAEGFDLTLRIAEAPESSPLVSQVLMPIPRLLCAAPAYLERAGMPTDPRMLQALSCLHYGHLPSSHHWTLFHEGTRVEIPVRGAFCSNNGDVLRIAAVQGLGITLLPEFIVAAELKQGTLVPVLPGVNPPPLSLYVMYPLNRHLSTKVMRLVAYLQEQIELLKNIGG